MLRVFRISAEGSASSTTRSAIFPCAIEPSVVAAPIARAELSVAAVIAGCGRHHPVGSGGDHDAGGVRSSRCVIRPLRAALGIHQSKRRARRGLKARQDRQRRVEDRPLRFHFRVERLHGRAIRRDGIVCGARRNPVGIVHGRVRDRRPVQVDRVRDHVDACVNFIERRRGKNRRVRPDFHALTVRLGRDLRDQVRREIGVNLDRRSAGGLCVAHRERQIRLRRHALHPRHLARHAAVRRDARARILEETRARHERRVVDARNRGIGALGERGEFLQRDRVARHIAHARDSAQQRAGQRLRRVRILPGGIGRVVHVGVDQPGDHELPREIHHARALGERTAAGRKDGFDDAAVRDDSLVRERRGAGAVDDCGVGERRARDGFTRALARGAA